MNKSFKLTEKGQKQLEAFKERQVKELLDDIIRIKDYPGVDEIEITGSDIDEYSKKWIYVGNSPKRSRYYFLKLCSYFYLAIGLCMLIASTFYEDLKRIYERSPEQISFMLASACLSLLAILMLIYIRNAESRHKMRNVHVNSEI